MIEIACIVLFNIIIYHTTVFNGLVMDDYQWYAQIKKFGFLKIKDIKSIALFRALINQHLYSGTTFGTNERIEHAFRVLLHILICIMIYFAFGHGDISFWAAMLYACNPINNQTSLWLNGRRYALNIILVLCMMIFPYSSLFLYPFSVLLQVTAIFSPVLLVNNSPWFLLMVPILLAIGWKEIKSKCDSRSNIMAEGDLKEFNISRLIVIVKTFGFFFFKMIMPGVCSMQYPDRFYWGLTKEGNRDAYSLNQSFWQGVVAMLGTLAIVLLLPKESAFWGIFMGLAILQWCAVLPIVQILSDRYMSLPNVFMMFFISYFAHFAGIFYIPLMVISCGYYLICLSVIMPMYKNLNAYYQYHINFYPSLPLPRTILINDLMNQGQAKMAEAQTFEGISHNPHNFRLLMWGAIMFLIRGDFKNSELILQEAERNFYINQEKDQAEEVKHLREQINKIKPRSIKPKNKRF